MRLRPWLAVAAAIVALLTVLATLTPAPAPAQARTFTWKVQSAFPVTDYPHRSLVELARSIEQMAGGRLKIEPLPALLAEAIGRRGRGPEARRPLPLLHATSTSSSASRLGPSIIAARVSPSR
jgi:hypothetical protein